MNKKADIHIPWRRFYFGLVGVVVLVIVIFIVAVTSYNNPARRDYDLYVSIFPQIGKQESIIQKFTKRENNIEDTKKVGIVEKTSSYSMKDAIIPEYADGFQKYKGVSLNLKGASHSKGVITKDGKIIYPEVFEGVDLIYAADSHNQLKEFFIVKDQPAFSQIKWRISYENLVARLSESNKVLFFDKEKNFKFAFTAPEIRDNNGKKITDESKINYVLNGDELVMNFDSTGLEYPLLVDPSTSTVVIDPSQARIAPNGSLNFQTWFGI